MTWSGPLEKISEFKYRIPPAYKKEMTVEGIIYASEQLVKTIREDKAPEQVANVACIPGIVKYSLAMPDIHWGYGFPIGGVAATDPYSGGVISPGGVGYDINCGVRLLRTNLDFKDVVDKMDKLANSLYANVPCGLGSRGKVRLSYKEARRLLIKGAAWLVSKGFGVKEDLDNCEESGAMDGADADAVSQRAYERGKSQVGSLGSGNHFLEVQVVDKVFDLRAQEFFGLSEGQLTVMIHSGSRGFGYQVCDDSLREMVRCLSKYNISLPDRQLASAPLRSHEAERYIAAMKSAANYAWANRQMLMHLVRLSFEKVFNKGWQSLEMDLIYDVAHNIAKLEKHILDGRKKELCVHRKGATRALGTGHPEVSFKYRNLGQPVIIPGSMGSFSYLLIGTKKAEEETFASTCHGAGRVKSRRRASRSLDFSLLMQALRKKEVIVKAAGKRTILEEAPQAYKDIDEVIRTVEGSGISKKICRLKPLCVIKG
ncbi:MAG: RNA-splicing ligase RtcB [Candidatus Omnitrophica bacterium]|nr:RNA-splicing ligase RtcB [Candidatus Omnitrophota bacterium]MBD3269015.1 RNA-splicing ligase RtcB [Candidatus Omnitrophota bacterium]